jgi:hypothetical protein
VVDAHLLGSRAAAWRQVRWCTARPPESARACREPHAAGLQRPARPRLSRRTGSATPRSTRSVAATDSWPTPSAGPSCSSRTGRTCRCSRPRRRGARRGPSAASAPPDANPPGAARGHSPRTPPPVALGRRCPAGAIWAAPRSAAPGLARVGAPRDLTRRRCPSAANELSAASSATRPGREHRWGVDALRRPALCEPLPLADCCEAPPSAGGRRTRRASPAPGRSSQPPRRERREPFDARRVRHCIALEHLLGRRAHQQLLHR